uniref:Major facilitator superfamily (MFS) profile domain-containing protein n=1 Tax=Arcella intermedia TaxID=1963864 RepID=A0A6B2L3V6_9EUKA
MLLPVVDQPQVEVYAVRWYILALFSALTFVQAALWITFSGILDVTVQFYNTTPAMMNWLLAIGNLWYLLCGPGMMWAFGAMRSPVKKMTLMAAFMCTVGSLVRCLSFLDPKAGWAMWVVAIGQSFISIAGPPVLIGPTKISLRWFPPEQRTLSTAISSTANSLGAGVGFLIAPYLTASFGIRMYLIIEAACTAFLFILLLIYFPDSPPLPPSISAQSDAGTSDEYQGPSTQEPESFAAFLSNSLQVLRNRSCLLIIFVGGWITGLMGSWQGMFDFFFESIFDSFFAGWMGFLFTLSSFIGASVGGYIGDTYFKFRYKSITIGTLTLTLLFSVLFTLCFPNFFYPHSIIPPSKALVGVLTSGIGVFYGIAYPIFYEFSAELTYPLSPELSSGLYTWWMNLFGIIVLGLGTVIPGSAINTMTLVGVFVSILPLFFVKEEYRRAKVDYAGTDVVVN